VIRRCAKVLPELARRKQNDGPYWISSPTS
jgi:hypothetical protein